MFFRSKQRVFSALLMQWALAAPVLGAPPVQLPTDYDIRLAADPASQAMRESLRAAVGKRAQDDAASKVRVARALEALRAETPGARIASSDFGSLPKMIATAVVGEGPLVPAAEDGNARTLRDFMKRHAGLYGLDAAQIDALVTVADYSNPDGILHWITLEQHIHGVPVFQGELRAGFSREGALIRTLQQFAADVDELSVEKEFGDSSEAVAKAAQSLGYPLLRGQLMRQANKSGSTAVHYERGPFASSIEAERTYFPVEPGVLRPAWRVLFWEANDAWYVVVDADTGALLWRGSLTAHQVQPASFGVYTGQSPSPMMPPPIAPDGSQPAGAVGRELRTLGPWPSYDNLGWITDGNNTTDGNNVEAGLDLFAPDGVDPGSHAAGAPYRVFNFAYNPYPGGGSPSLDAYRDGVVTNLFYWANVFHDRTYELGFTEQARNFQHNNFGRGGLGEDRISAEAQDPARLNNATFTTAADGTRGRYQVGLRTAPAPDIDGAVDQDVTLHEFAHGLSARLIGNGMGGLAAMQSAALSEGWSDCMALFLQAGPEDDLDAIQAIGEYAYTGSTPSNQYYGMRRFPYARKSSRGGPMLRPHNPLTLADFDPAQFSIDDGAYPPQTLGTATQPHDAGEIWCSALVEIHANLIERHGFAVGNKRMLQMIVDGMKLTPFNPSFIQARDAILAAADAAGFEDDGPIWHGFATRGFGIGAAVVGNSVKESFEAPVLMQSPDLGYSDAACNADGVIDPGEHLGLAIPISNVTASPISNARLSLNGGAPIAYGTLGPGAMVMRSASLQVPASHVCGAPLTLHLTIDSNEGSSSIRRALPTGFAEEWFTERFDNAVEGQLPPGWTATSAPLGTEWGATAGAPISGAMSARVLMPGSAVVATMTSPSFVVPSSGGVLRFDTRFAFENTRDGGVLEIAIGGGGFQDIVAAGGTFLSGGYNRTLQAGGCNMDPNPLGGRAAWSDSGAFEVEIALPPSAAGNSVRLRWRAGSDCSIASSPWRVDNITVRGAAQCAISECTLTVFEDGFEQ